jgi:integrase
MQKSETPETWQKTSVQNLVRHKTGRYYARAYSGGKEIWKSLKTSAISVAKARLADFMKEQREKEVVYQSTFNGKMTVGDAIELHKRKLAENVRLKPSTRKYWQEVITALLKSWPGLAEIDVRKINPSDCRTWASKFAQKSSPTRYNSTIAVLKHAFDVAVESGARYNNPAAIVKRIPYRQKPLDLPSREQFLKFIQVMETAGGRDSRNCADFVCFLAFSGCRRGEAAQIEWRDIDFDQGEVVVRGDAETGTKNWEIRRVPMIPELKKLLERMRSERPKDSEHVKVLQVREAQKAMDRAAKKVGMHRIIHHHLRHLFATICIESGVDVPTVSRWLGHKDGGALAMKTYGHLRNEHSKAAAQKVRFGGLETGDGKVTASAAP